MRPTPLGKKTYEEYAKELKEFNLSAEPKLTKVELGLVDDLKININSLSSNKSILVKVANDMVKINSEITSILPKAKDRAKVGKSMIEVTADKIQLAEKQVGNVEKLVKELGLNINEIEEIKEVEKLIKENKNTLETVERYQNTMESISKLKL